MTETDCAAAPSFWSATETFTVALAALTCGGRDLGAGIRHAEGTHGLEPGVAEDATARVPAAARLLIVEPNGEDIRAAELGAGGEVTFVRDEAVRACANLRSVHVHGAVHVRAIELDEDPLSLARRGQRECLSVPPDAAVEVPTARSCR